MWFAIIPSWIRRALAWALAGMAAFSAVWIAGRRDGAQAAKNKAEARRTDDLQMAKEARDEVDSSSDADVSKRLHPWGRD